MIPRRLTRAMLLFQYVVLVVVAFGESRVLGYQLRNDGYYPMGCTGIPLTATLTVLLAETLGITAVLGVLAQRSWARLPYIVLLAVETWMVSDVVLSPYFAADLPEIVLFAMYASSLLTLASFFTGVRIFQRAKSA